MFMPGKYGEPTQEPRDEHVREKTEHGFNEKLEVDLKSDRYLEVHKTDIKAFRAFRRTFHLDRLNADSLNIYYVHPERNAAITRAFEKNGKVPHFDVLTESKDEAAMFAEKSGLPDVKKGDAEWHRTAERMDIVVVLDPEIRLTHHLLKNVAPGGWLLCRIAEAARLRGKYKFMGVVERGSGDPHVREYGDEFWEKVEVRSDDEYSSAQKLEGVVTKEKAQATLDRAGLKVKDNDVIKTYAEFLDRLRDEGAEMTPEGNLVYMAKIKQGKEEVEERVEFDPRLPTKAGEHEDDIVVMKKHEMV